MKEKMKDMQSFFKGTAGKLVMLVVVVIAGFLIRVNLDRVYEERQTGAGTGEVTNYDGETRVGRELDYAESVTEDNLILKVFQNEHPEAEVVVAYEEDITNDGCKDLVVIYETEEDD